MYLFFRGENSFYFGGFVIQNNLETVFLEIYQLQNFEFFSYSHYLNTSSVFNIEKLQLLDEDIQYIYNLDVILNILDTSYLEEL